MFCSNCNKNGTVVKLVNVLTENKIETRCYTRKCAPCYEYCAICDKPGKRIWLYDGNIVLCSTHMK